MSDYVTWARIDLPKASIMTSSEPSRQWQEQQHQRISRNDPTAFAELCEVVLEHLVSFLRAQFPQHEAHLHEMVAIDCLMDYQIRPEQFDPERLSLFAYLRMAARYDLLNKIDKNRRRDQRLFDIDDPNVQVQLPEQATIQEEVALDEWLEGHTELSREEILESLDAELDGVDKQILLLMLEGVRENSRYAGVMGILDQAEPQQRREVKRAKDRINKRLQRFGRRIDRN